MDRRHAADSQWFISPVVDLREFLETAYQAEAALYNTYLRSHNSINEENFYEAHMLRDLMEITGCRRGTGTNVLEKDLPLENFIDAERDTTRRQWDDQMEDEVIPEKSELKTHELLQERLASQSVAWKKNEFMRKLKYYRQGFHDTSLHNSHVHWNQPCDKDIIMTVDYCVPFNKTPLKEELNGIKMLQPYAKFLVRGDTYLLELRKKFVCVSDMIVELAEGAEYQPPDMSQSHMALYPSSFIFINDTFYIDFSLQGSTDISAPIREFMARKKIFDPVQVKSMDGVRMIDLKLRLGQPYLFMHSGTCEHLLIFHDLGLLHKSHEQDINKYPMLAYEKSYDTKCHACKSAFAAIHVLDCDRLPSPNMLFCDPCFKEFHFLHGKKLGSFRAFPFFHANRISFA